MHQLLFSFFTMSEELARSIANEYLMETLRSDTSTGYRGTDSNVSELLEE